ncbi:unnamed protein product [Effrenium voratum]|nr:unnamed protein product [Effrenium voratum]
MPLPELCCKLETLSRSLVSCIECPICMEVMTEAASGYCGHCFCIGCFGCSLSSSFSCPTCRKPVVDLVRQFTVEQIAAHIPLLKDLALQLGVFSAQSQLELDASRRLGALEQELQKERQRAKYLEQRLLVQERKLQEQIQQCQDLQRAWELESQEAMRQNQELQEEVSFLRESNEKTQEALRCAKLLENAIVNIMEHMHSMMRLVIGSGWQELCVPLQEAQVQELLGLSPSSAFAEFGIIRDCLHAGQECMGNMSLGISSDWRFKLEYYGSSQHVFNELEMEGTVQLEGSQLTLLGTRSASSCHDGQDSEVQKTALPPLRGLLCSREGSTWIVVFDFTACAQISIFNSTDIILLKDPGKHFTGYQSLTW